MLPFTISKSTIANLETRACFTVTFFNFLLLIAATIVWLTKEINEKKSVEQLMTEIQSVLYGSQSLFYVASCFVNRKRIAKLYLKILNIERTLANIAVFQRKKGFHLEFAAVSVAMMATSLNDFFYVDGNVALRLSSLLLGLYPKLFVLNVLYVLFSFGELFKASRIHLQESSKLVDEFRRFDKVSTTIAKKCNIASVDCKKESKRKKNGLRYYSASRNDSKTSIRNVKVLNESQRLQKLTQTFLNQTNNFFDTRTSNTLLSGDTKTCSKPTKKSYDQHYNFPSDTAKIYLTSNFKLHKTRIQPKPTFNPPSALNEPQTTYIHNPSSVNSPHSTPSTRTFAVLIDVYSEICSCLKELSEVQGASLLVFSGVAFCAVVGMAYRLLTSTEGRGLLAVRLTVSMGMLIVIPFEATRVGEEVFFEF